MLRAAAACVTQGHAATFCTIQFEISLDRLLAMLDFGIESWTANRYLINHTQTLTIKDVMQVLS